MHESIEKPPQDVYLVGITTPEFPLEVDDHIPVLELGLDQLNWLLRFILHPSEELLVTEEQMETILKAWGDATVRPEALPQECPLTPS